MVDHPFNFNFPASRVANVANAATLTELMGIKMATTIGDKMSCNCKGNPNYIVEKGRNVFLTNNSLEHV